MMSTMDFDLTAIPREFPQFGKSVWNLGRTREEVFGGDGSKCGTAGAGSGKCAEAGCGCSGCGCEGGSCGCSSGGGCGSAGGRHAQDAEGDPFGLGDPQVPVDPVYAARRDWGPRKPARFGRVEVRDPDIVADILTTKKCGGDVTDLMIDVMKDAHKKCSSFTPANILLLLNEYYDKLTGELDWKVNPPKGADCNKECPVTLCVCKSCMDASVPANVMYGYITAACGVPNFYAKRKAFDFALKKKQRKDPKVRDPRGVGNATIEQLANEFNSIWPPHDQAAVALGYLLGELGKTDKDFFCGVFDAQKTRLQGPDNPDCKGAPCC